MKNIAKKIKSFISQRYLIFIIFLYVFIALFMTWPLVLNMNGFLLPEIYPDISHSDSIEHTSRINEVRELLKENKNPLFVDKTDISLIYIFFGLFVTYIFNVSDIFFHNLYLLITIFLSGFFMYLFAKELTNDKLSSFFAGFIYLSSQYVSYAYFWGHSNTSQIQWIPLVFLFTERLIKNQSYKNMFLLALALTLQIISVSQTTIYLSFILPFYVFLRIIFLEWDNIFDIKFLFKYIKMFFFVFIFLIIMISWYIPYKKSYEPIIRTIEENTRGYWVAKSFVNFFHPASHLSFNSIPILLFFIALYLIFKNYKKMEVKKYMPFIVIFFFVLLCMFGPISIFMPYTWLYYFWPYINHFRVPFRMFPFALMCFSVIIGYFIIFLKQNLRKDYFFITIIIIFSIMLIHIYCSYWFLGASIYYID
jgi:hypothetical protein